jgi:hypothetical protein
LLLKEADPPSVPSSVKEKMTVIQRSNEKLHKRLSGIKTPAKRQPQVKKQKRAKEEASKFLTGLSLQVFITQILLSCNKSSHGNRYSDVVKLIYAEIDSTAMR